jgi:DNA-binding CsgD family transcriptional regulator
VFGLYASDMLHGRGREREQIGFLVDEAWAFRGGALVLRGLPGVGKSTLLAEAVSRAEGMQVLTTQGIESESPLPFAALQRLLRPVMRFANQLAESQARALLAAFGEEAGSGDDRFLVFVAALSLLAETAEQAPVLCVVDDAHWLDDASSATLTFVARRLGPERIALLFAARDGDVRRFESDGIAELAIGGLDLQSAGALLDERTGRPVPTSVRDALMRQTGGNPLALVELPLALSAAQLAGEEPLPPELPLTDEVQRVFLQRSQRLSSATQTLLLVAATDSSTKAPIVTQAGEKLGAGQEALDEAEQSGLLKVRGSMIELRHPLVRSAVYQGATSSARRAAHSALADVMVASEDADRRAWHRAAATDQPDAAVAADLDEAAERAHRRGGHEAASAALERAAQLTTDDDGRARRFFAASLNSWLAGQMTRAKTLANDARLHTSDPVLRADIDRLRGRIELNIGTVSLAIRIWTQAAREVAVVDRQRAREIAMIAAAASTFVEVTDRTDLEPRELFGAVDASASTRDRCFAGLLIGFHALLHDDLGQATAQLRMALEAGRDLTETDLLTNMGIAAFHIDDDEAFRRCFTRLLAQSRDSGAGGVVLFALPRLGLAHLVAGQWSSVTAVATEAIQLAHSTGQAALTAMPLAELALISAQQGGDDYDDLLRQLDAVMTTRQTTGVLGGLVGDTRNWAQGCRAALAGDIASAVHHFGQMKQSSLIRLAAYDRLDAAFRAGQPELAGAWLADLELFTREVPTARGRAVVAHGQALASSGSNAEALFEAAIEYQSDAARPFEAARTQLAYGEFLRRARRRVDAREHLRAALTTFEDVGAQTWAERARQELRASGESARKRDESTRTELTPQERQVARFVAEGLSNRDVAARLFLSPRTIDFHLRNVFTKTGVSSRGELARLALD